MKQFFVMILCSGIFQINAMENHEIAVMQQHNIVKEWLHNNFDPSHQCYKSVEQLLYRNDFQTIARITGIVLIKNKNPNNCDTFETQ